MNEATPLDQAALAAHPLPPVIDGDKESKGRILVIAGSREVPARAGCASPRSIGLRRISASRCRKRG